MKSIIQVVHLACLVLTANSFKSCSETDASDMDSTSFEMSCDQSNEFSEIGYPGFGNPWEDFKVVDTYGYYESFSDAYVLYVTNFADAEARRESSTHIDFDVDLGENYVKLILSRRDGADPQPGTYDFTSDNIVSAKLTRGSTNGFDNVDNFTSFPTGQVDITYMDESKVCGNIEVSAKEGGTLVIKGEFSIALRG